MPFHCDNGFYYGTGKDIFGGRCQTITNPINCVGIQGAGLALQFKQRYPSQYADYVTRCAAGTVQLGEPYVFEITPVRCIPVRLILQFPTKRDWRDRSDIESIRLGLAHVNEWAHIWGITSLAMPLIGTGLGKLRPAEVKLAIEQELAQLSTEIPIAIHLPQ